VLCQSYADRLIVYLTFYIAQCLTHLSRNQFDKDSALKVSKKKKQHVLLLLFARTNKKTPQHSVISTKLLSSRFFSKQELYQLAIKNFQVPGDKGFPLGGMVTAPQNRGDTGKQRNIAPDDKRLL
jgi:hypothetical protein